MNEPKYYSLTESSGSDTADLYIFGTICRGGQWYEDDPDRSAYNIVNELKNVQASNINVYIDSYGGDVSEGLAIYNILRNSGKTVTTYDYGFACSAASVVFLAGSRRVMANASLLMIHNAWTSAVGNANDLRKAAEDIETITQASIEAYKQVATISEEEIKDLMDNESWILPADAVRYGFATEVSDPEELEGAQQSAFLPIMNKLTAPQAELEEIEALEIKACIDPSDIEAIADAVTKKLTQIEPKKTAKQSAVTRYLHKNKGK